MWCRRSRRELFTILDEERAAALTTHPTTTANQISVACPPIRVSLEAFLSWGRTVGLKGLWLET
jgi:hypothetical protein